MTMKGNHKKLLQSIQAEFQRWGAAITGSIVTLFTIATLYNGALFNTFGIRHIALLTTLLGALLWRHKSPPKARGWFADFLKQSDLVTIPLSAVLVLASAMGPDASLLFPLTLLILVWVAASLSSAALAVALVFSIAGELVLTIGGTGLGGNISPLMMHLAFIAAFAAGGAVLLRVEVGATRQVVRKAVENKQVTDRMQAKALGIGATGSDVEFNIQNRLTELRSNFECVLKVARSAVNADTAVLLTKHTDNTFLMCRSATDRPGRLNKEEIQAGIGIMGVIARCSEEEDIQRVLRLAPLEGQMKELPYYCGTSKHVGSLMAVPICTAEQLVGIVFFDRKEQTGFSSEDATEALECARILGRMLETERALLVSDHRSDVLEHLINASRALTNAFSPEQVYETVVKTVCHFAPLRFSALIIQDNKTGIPMIAHAIGENGVQCCGKTLFPGASLATMVLKTPSIMPTSRTWTSQNGPLLDGGLGPLLSTGDPVVCIPLMAHKRVVGSLALVGSARFEDEAIRLITLLASQAAISVEHAQTLAELQVRATTDNLTSLDNRATIEQKLNQSVARSARQNQELTVLLLDLDHFKTINDTYGHPAGDMVLRQVSRLLEDCKRVNDSVGRFGGEEFIVILEDTGDAGARLVADRIRQRIASIQFPSSQGSFSVTASIGFSISGRDAKSPADLVKRADQALYQVKNNGRNQVRGYRDNSTTIAQSA